MSSQFPSVQPNPTPSVPPASTPPAADPFANIKGPIGDMLRGEGPVETGMRRGMTSKMLNESIDQEGDEPVQWTPETQGPQFDKALWTHGTAKAPKDPRAVSETPADDTKTHAPDTEKKTDGTDSGKKADTPDTGKPVVAGDESKGTQDKANAFDAPYDKKAYYANNPQHLDLGRLTDWLNQKSHETDVYNAAHPGMVDKAKSWFKKPKADDGKASSTIDPQSKVETTTDDKAKPDANGTVPAKDKPAATPTTDAKHEATKPDANATVPAQDKSTTTLENLTFSRQIMLKDKPDYRCTIVTSNYHVLRAALYARRAKVNGQVLGAPTARYFWPNAFLREFVADGVSWAHLDIAGPAYHDGPAYGYVMPVPPGGAGPRRAVVSESFSRRP